MNRIVFGSMRMTLDKLSVDDWTELFIFMFDNGINTLHSSAEYESFPLFLKTLEKVSSIRPDIQFKHIVKLAEPHFDESEFCCERFNMKIKQYQEALEVERIDYVQWMWRSNSDDSRRIEKFTTALPEIKKCFTNLKKSRNVGKFYCFPYTPEFMKRAQDVSLFDGYCVYRNPEENEYDELLKKSDKNSVITIRPFRANKLLIQSQGVKSLLDYNFSDPSVDKTIISLSSKDQVLEIKGIFCG